MPARALSASQAPPAPAETNSISSGGLPSSLFLSLLHSIERQCLMRLLDGQSLTHLARCSRQLLADASHAFVWRHLPPIELELDEPNEAELQILSASASLHVRLAGVSLTIGWKFCRLPAALDRLHRIRALNFHLTVSLEVVLAAVPSLRTTLERLWLDDEDVEPVGSMSELMADSATPSFWQLLQLRSLRPTVGFEDTDEPPAADGSQTAAATAVFLRIFSTLPSLTALSLDRHWYAAAPIFAAMDAHPGKIRRLKWRCSYRSLVSLPGGIHSVFSSAGFTALQLLSLDWQEDQKDGGVLLQADETGADKQDANLRAAFAAMAQLELLHLHRVSSVEELFPYVALVPRLRHLLLTAEVRMDFGHFSYPSPADVDRLLDRCPQLQFALRIYEHEISSDNRARPGYRRHCRNRARIEMLRRHADIPRRFQLDPDLPLLPQQVWDTTSEDEDVPTDEEEHE